MVGSGPDLRDGDRASWPGLARDLSAYLQPSGEIAIWDGHRHVVVGADRKGWKVAVQMLRRAA